MISTIPLQSNPHFVAISPDATRAYVSLTGINLVSIIDTESNTVVESVPVGNFPQGLAVTPDGSRVYVANFQDRVVSVIDTQTSSVDSISVGERPFDVAITPSGDRVYVTKPFPPDNVSVIDTGSNEVVDTIPVPGPQAIDISPDGSRAYVTQFSSNRFHVIDLATNEVSTVTLLGRVNIIGVAFSPNGETAYIANQGSNDVSVIATATNTEIGTVPGMVNPFWIAFTPDGARAYVTNSRSPEGNSVSVIDTASGQVVGNPIPVGTSPKGIAITPFISDLAITKTASSDTVQAGSNLTYTIEVTNNGPDPGLSVTVTDELPAETRFQSVMGPDGWSCIAPEPGETGTVTCTASASAVNETALLTLTVSVNGDVPDGTIINNTATVSSRTFDPDPDNNSATSTVTVSNP